MLSRGRIPALLWFVLSLAPLSSGVSNERSRAMVIRLLTPVASYLPAGTRFSARVIGPELRDGADLLPNDSIVTGTIKKAASVRFGVWRERAMLQLAFDGCQLPDGAPRECTVGLEAVDNARESVNGDRIQGVVAASHPPSLLTGVWYKPESLMVPRAAMGLTGAAGTVYMHFMPTPIGAAAMIGSEVLLDRMPDPEISYPAGTDLLVRVEVPANIAPSPELPAPVPADLAQWVVAQPHEVYLPDHRLAGDMIHLVFVGSREEVEHAFQAAGWTVTVPLTRRSFAHMYAAYNSMKADPTAPIAPLTYRGATSALAFQKTLNTVAKRHHIRIWPGSYSGTQVWLAAATHDTSIAFDRKHMKATHHIDPLIDRERTTVENDLASTGCVAGIGSVARPLAVRTAGSGEPSVTDGNAAVLFLQDCSPAPPAGFNLLEPRRRPSTIAMRRFFLEDRQYLMRDNIYYWLYRAGSSFVKREFRIDADLGPNSIR